MGVRIQRPTKPIISALLATGQALFSLSDITAGSTGLVFERKISPFFIDGIALLAYPAIAASLFVLIRGRTSRRDRAGLLDASIILRRHRRVEPATKRPSTWSPVRTRPFTRPRMLAAGAR